MKKFRWFMIIVVSICFLIGIVSIGWSIEAQKGTAKQGTQVQIPGTQGTPIQTPHCPPGFAMNADGSSCDRTKPANPCASGFHVEWGTCITGTPGPLGLGAGDPYPCGYKCIPNMPAAGSYYMICPAKHYPASEGLNVGACSVSCKDVIY